MISFVEQRSFLIGKTKATLTHTNIKNFCLRFLVSAAHCLNNWDDNKFLTPWDEYQDIKSRIQVTLRINGQFKENIEIKRAYQHPLYHYPGLYNNIAILELGRRIEYGFNKFGDSPVCIDNGKMDLGGQIATFEVE